MQSLVPDPKANYRNVPDALVKIFHQEGLKNTVRGINALVVGAGPAHALYFACYEKLKRVFSGGRHSNHIANGKYVELVQVTNKVMELCLFSATKVLMGKYEKKKLLN